RAGAAPTRRTGKPWAIIPRAELGARAIVLGSPDAAKAALSGDRAKPREATSFTLSVRSFRYIGSPDTHLRERSGDFDRLAAISATRSTARNLRFCHARGPVNHDCALRGFHTPGVMR